jgi:predicted site-specific integrase-resolvase
MCKELKKEAQTRYLTQQEVALLFRVSLSTVKNWRDAGLLDYFQPPGSTRVLYPKDSVEEFERQSIKKAKVLAFKRPDPVKKEVGRALSSTRIKKWRLEP